MMSNLIIFSHLRWNFVYQRPQHLMTRLARQYRIFFIEEPVFHDGEGFLETQEVAPNVRVLRPHTPISAGGFHDDQLPELEPLLQTFIQEANLKDYVIWLYTPMALPLARGLEPCAIIYDCMDELSAFKNAPRQLLQRESALLKVANIVFTGGPSLYRAKRERHPEVYCFPSSVDSDHFAQALRLEQEHPEQRNLPHPRLGFYGVIDERLDLTLIEALADARPDWQLVLVGPVVKIDAAHLPRRANIHYFGQQPYEALPQFLAGWDVCLLPFALNDATRFISPTKTLEYMAAELPIVSTPITDVAEPYGEIVAIAKDPVEFIAACEQALSESPQRAAERTAKMQAVLAGTSWDQTAAEMHALIKGACARGLTLTEAGRAMLPPAGDSGLMVSKSPPPSQRFDCVVMGAGPTGLSAAYHLGADSLLVDQNDKVGGWCRSVYDGGFTFDYAGHIMFSNDPYVLELYKLLLGDNVHWQDREAWIHSKGVYTRYPFQGALYGLPAQVIKECIVGAIEACFGSLKKAAEPARPAPQMCKSESIGDCCADGVMESTAPLGTLGSERQSAPRNFEEFIYKVWGAGIAKHFAIPYNRKLWTVPLSEMETSWLGGRVPMPDIEELIEGSLQPVAKPMGPNARFGYPLRGGFQALMNGFIPHLEGELRLESKVAQVSPTRGTITLADGSTFGYEQLISTLPLPVLIQCMGDEAPAEIQEAARGLRHVSIRCVNLGVGRERLTEKHWIYCPEDTVFHRIFVQGNASPHCNPPGGFGLTCEISYSEHKPLPGDGEALIRLCVEGCVKMGMMRADDPLITANQVDMPYAYVVYDHARAQNVKRIRDWLADYGIILAGRYSEWEYYNSDHAFIAGKRAAEQVKQARRRGRSSGLRSA